jgi:hypothetical protein
MKINFVITVRINVFLLYFSLHGYHGRAGGFDLMTLLVPSKVYDLRMITSFNYLQSPSYLLSAEGAWKISSGCEIPNEVTLSTASLSQL